MRSIKNVLALDGPKELTLRAIILGLILALIFGIGNAYLGLRVGMTVSASIPAAVVSMAVLRTCFRRVTNQENNIVQCMASAGEAVAAGTVLALPSLALIGETLNPWHIFQVAILGGFLGVLMMIPLRHLMIVEEEKTLMYPEGRACAAILEAGAQKGSGAIRALWGMLAAAVYQTASSLAHLWPSSLSFSMYRPLRTVLSIDISPALLGVGYIIGPRIGSQMLSGGILVWLVLIPIMQSFSQLAAEANIPAMAALAQLSPQDTWHHYIRYIGAGCVAFGGLVSLARVIPILMRTAKQMWHGRKTATHHVEQQRMDTDLPLPWVLFGILAIILLFILSPSLSIGWVAGTLLLVACVMFVTVTCITTGIVGSSSNPVSSMAITTLLFICGVFLALDWTSRPFLISALTTAAIACTAIAMAGDTAQDLKTGYLVKGTPALQQIALLLGTVLPAAAMGWVLILLNNTYGIGSAALPAPQATLLALVAKGVLEASLPIGLVIMGASMGLAFFCMRLNVLAVALGVYLPIELSAALFMGGVARAASDWHRSDSDGPGTLLASGFVAGDSLMGLLVAGLTASHILHTPTQPGSTLLGAAAYLILFVILIVGGRWNRAAD